MRKSWYTLTDKAFQSYNTRTRFPNSIRHVDDYNLQMLIRTWLRGNTDVNIDICNKKYLKSNRERITQNAGTIRTITSLWFSCSGCAQTLRFNRYNKWSIGFKSRVFAGHLSFCTLFATIITSVLLVAWHDAKSRATIIPWLGRIWRKRTDRMTSFRYLIAVMFHWMVTLGVFVCMKTLFKSAFC